jgi:hypothetical protein
MSTNNLAGLASEVNQEIASLEVKGFEHSSFDSRRTIKQLPKAQKEYERFKVAYDYSSSKEYFYRSEAMLLDYSGSKEYFYRSEAMLLDYSGSKEYFYRSVAMLLQNTNLWMLSRRHGHSSRRSRLHTPGDRREHLRMPDGGVRHVRCCCPKVTSSSLVTRLVPGNLHDPNVH